MGIFLTQFAFSQTKSMNITSFTNVTDIDGSGTITAGDVINFNLHVKNDGNIQLNNLNFSETSVKRLDNNSAVGTVTFIYQSSSQSNAVGTIISNETEIYSGTYTLTVSDISAGGVSFGVTGQSSSPGQSNDVSDVSDDGDDGDGNTTNDRNIVTAGETAGSIEVNKFFSGYQDVDGNGVWSPGDIVTYGVEVINNGYQEIITIVPDDALVDGGGNAKALTAPFTPPGVVFQGSTHGNISDAGAGNGTTTGTLLVGEKVEYQATFTLDQATIDSGQIRNCFSAQAIVKSTGSNVNDSLDTCVDTTIPHVPVIEVTKIASVDDVNNSSTNDVGDIITYDIFIENKGNVTISGIGFNETFTDGLGNSLSLTSGPTYISSTKSSAQGTLSIAEIERYRATFQISASAANSGQINNSLKVTANSPGQTNNVSDTSDDGIDDDGNTADDPTVTTATIVKSLDVTKIAQVIDNGDGEIGAGDIIRYTITVLNTGQINLSNLFFSDNLRNGVGTIRNYDAPGITGGSNNPLQPNQSYTYTASYTIQAGDTATGQIENQVTVLAKSNPSGGFDVSDVSDDGIDTDGNLVNDKTITLLNIQTGVEVVKTAVLTDDGDGLPSAGDVITYTIVILNTGNVTLENLNLSDVHKRGPFASGTVVPFDSGPTFTSATAGSSSTLLLAGGQLTYTATYTVVGADVTAGLMSNRATIAADDVTAANNSVSDNSDDGDDLDGNTTDDPTEVKLTYDGKLDVSKTVQVTQADPNKIELGDTAVYTIVVTNTGNVRLTNISLNDQLSGVNGVSLSLDSPGVKFVSSSGGSASGTLEVGESASYTATFTVNQEAIDQTGFQNTVEATGRDPANALVSDDSDDADDSDGNRLNDPTVTPIPADPSIDVVKTSSHQDVDGDGEISAGDRINYTITISNTGNNTLGVDGAPSGELVVQDIVSTIAGTHTPTVVGPSFVSSSLGSNFGVIKPNEMAIFSAYVIITQDIVNAGGLSNIASVTAQDPSNTAITDTSDDGDDNDGNLTNDPTIDVIPANPSINIVKTVTVSDTNGNGINDIGDVANYTITISNTGNIDIASIIVTDTLSGLSTGTLSLTQSLTFVSASRGSNSDVLLVNEQANYIAKFTINQNAAGRYEKCCNSKWA